mmetsp:Transcript_20606/g.37068  ORF Transcript_20606/g.37068 Transcript_20606/m.37068 type:complete len:472 (-) Transcript_20606:127-1542(-)
MILFLKLEIFHPGRQLFSFLQADLPQSCRSHCLRKYCLLLVILPLQSKDLLCHCLHFEAHRLFLLSQKLSISCMGRILALTLCQFQPQIFRLLLFLICLGLCLFQLLLEFEFLAAKVALHSSCSLVALSAGRFLFLQLSTSLVLLRLEKHILAAQANDLCLAGLKLRLPIAVFGTQIINRFLVGVHFLCSRLGVELLSSLLDDSFRNLHRGHCLSGSRRLSCSALPLRMYLTSIAPQNHVTYHLTQDKVLLFMLIHLRRYLHLAHCARQRRGIGCLHLLLLALRSEEPWIHLLERNVRNGAGSNRRLLRDSNGTLARRGGDTRHVSWNSICDGITSGSRLVAHRLVGSPDGGHGPLVSIRSRGARSTANRVVDGPIRISTSRRLEGLSTRVHYSRYCRSTSTWQANTTNRCLEVCGRCVDHFRIPICRLQTSGAAIECWLAIQHFWSVQLGLLRPGHLELIISLRRWIIAN